MAAPAHPLAAAILQATSQDQPDNRTTKQRVYASLEKAHANIDRMNRMLKLIDDIGEDKVERLLAFMEGDDPDKSKPTMVVGPHGPGCTCPPEDPSGVASDPDETVN